MSVRLSICCRRGHEGFTLVELMIVVTIIGLLAMIAIPAYSHARNKSQTEICHYNQRLIFDQMNVYCLDTGDPLDSSRFPNLCACRDALCPTWGSPSDRYIKDRRVFSCPTNPNQATQHDYGYIKSGSQIVGISCNINSSHN